MPMPKTMPPIAWLRAVLAFRMRPAAKAPTRRLTLISRNAEIDPHLDELCAEGMHREVLLFIARSR